MNLLLVMAGGAAGAVARYAAGLLVAKMYKAQTFPIATLCINLAGSAGLGLVLAWQFTRGGDTLSEMLGLLLGVGFLGAFTTFSAFSVETLALLQQRRRGAALLYVGCSIAGSAAAFALSYGAVSWAAAL